LHSFVGMAEREELTSRGVTPKSNAMRALLTMQ
jgi:hypothetical protein